MLDEDRARRLSLPKHIGSLGHALTVAELAALLQVSERHIYHLVQIGAIPHFKVGNTVRFDPEALGKWLAESMAKNDFSVFKDRKHPMVLDDERKA
jgi:excisionase family DNA binding protein